MKRLFGTDGIRGAAGVAPLDPPTVRRFGAALAEVLAGALAHSPRIVFGRDTRESGTWLRDEVAVGLASRNASFVDAGVVTTPGLAFIAHTGPFDAGVMISASHNPFEDNGLKVFAHDGAKLSDELEARIEAKMLDAGVPVPSDAKLAVPIDETLVNGYLDFLCASLPQAGHLNGIRVLLDCANGSASRIAPEVFRRLGAVVEVSFDAPDGRNINLRCGSLHLDELSKAVRRGGFDVGIAFDGDADRALAVDRTGRVVDGDHILYLVARGLRRRGSLRHDLVVSTVMSNFWLERRLADEGMRMLRAPVGDKYVYEKMVETNASLGGEQSGHVILRDHARTGDGILTALTLLDCVRDEDRPLERILDDIVPFPQVLLNVRVREKPDLHRHPVVGPAAARVDEQLSGRGRVLLRYSGTEPLARVMIEGPDEAEVRRLAEGLAETIRLALGA